MNGDLSYGNLNERDFPDLWTGLEAQDLRRAMITADLPNLCMGCRFGRKLPPQAELPFINQLEEERFQGPIRRDFVVGPEHLCRAVEAPNLQWRHPARGIRSYTVVLSLGGESPTFPGDRDYTHVEELCLACPVDAREGEVFTARVPEDFWGRLQPNLGYWWIVVASFADPRLRPIRSKKALCLIRHRAIERLPGSRVRYASSQKSDGDS